MLLQPPSGARARHLSAPVIVGSAAFVQAFDTSAVAIALPAMADDLGVPALSLNVVLTSYLVGATAIVPVSGWAADRFGARRMFLVSLIAFALASLACAFATGLVSIVALRAIQGGAGALLLPVGRTLVLRTEPREHMVKALALLTFPVMLGPLLGPVVGGALVEWGSWRWLFVMTSAAALAGLAPVRRFVAKDRPHIAAPLDLTGLLLAGLALSGLSYGLGSVARGGTASLIAQALIAAGCASAFIYVRHARDRARPLVDLGVLRHPGTRLSIIGGIFTRQLVTATPFLLALQFQIGLGLSPVTSGSLIVSSAVGALLGRSLLTLCVKRIGIRRLILGNGFVLALSTAACGLLTTATPATLIVLLLFVQGASRSLQNIALMTIGFIGVPDAEVGAASTIASMSQYFAFAAGIALAVLGVEAARGASEVASLAPATFGPAFVGLGAVSLFSLLWLRRLEAPATAR